MRAKGTIKCAVISYFLAEKDQLCESTAMLLHWIMLSQFSWMSIMSFELLHTLYTEHHISIQ